MKRPNINFDSAKQTIEQWTADLDAYRHATGKCPVCGERLTDGIKLSNDGYCPQGH